MGRWIENLEFNFTFFKVTDAKNKKAARMIYGGQALRKIHNNLPDPENGNDYENAKSKLTAYFAPKKNVDFLIYQFREVVQDEHEPFLTFVNRLREIGKHCNFDDLDIEVKRQTIQKTSNRKVRQKALEKELSYDEIIRIGIADETKKKDKPKKWRKLLQGIVVM